MVVYSPLPLPIKRYQPFEKKIGAKIITEKKKLVT